MLATLTNIGDVVHYRESVAPYFRNLLILNPEPELMTGADVTFIFQLHVTVVWFLFAFWPFSRLVHAWSVPVDYLRRSPILYRSRTSRPTPAPARPAPGADRGRPAVKRSAELTPLSHDHHQALFVALQLKRAEDAGPPPRLRRLPRRRRARSHFEIEEAILLPGWVAADPGADRDGRRTGCSPSTSRSAPPRQRLRSGDADRRASCTRSASCSRRHVRFEERELFPAIEAGSTTSPSPPGRRDRRGRIAGCRRQPPRPSGGPSARFDKAADRHHERRNG